MAMAGTVNIPLLPRASDAGTEEPGRRAPTERRVEGVRGFEAGREVRRPSRGPTVRGPPLGVSDSAVRQAPEKIR